MKMPSARSKRIKTEHDPDQDEEEIMTQRPTQSTATSDLGEFTIGAITRIKLKNFVTYDSVDFIPGPSMNMIIGPNGTGKSTIVCAIAIGLSASPKVLGRQKELKDFIKRGKDEAEIEITLYPNHRITRKFFVNENNRCETRWKINSIAPYVLIS
jgi:predicted ATP-dependent endonuclease of OLD family